MGVDAYEQRLRNLEVQLDMLVNDLDPVIVPKPPCGCGEKSPTAQAFDLGMAVGLIGGALLCYYALKYTRPRCEP